MRVWPKAWGGPTAFSRQGELGKGGRTVVFLGTAVDQISMLWIAEIYAVVVEVVQVLLLLLLLRLLILVALDCGHAN